MPRKNFSKGTIKDRLEHAKYQCEATLTDGTRCPAKAERGRFQADHDNPDGLTGKPTFENCRILCTACHLEKTRKDVERISKAKRNDFNHLGVTKVIGPDRPLRSAPMPTTKKAAERAERGSKPPASGVSEIARRFGLA